MTLVSRCSDPDWGSTCRWTTILPSSSSFTSDFDHLRDHSLSTSRVLNSPLLDSLQPNEALNNVTVDIVGTYMDALEARREHHPLLLGGVMIEDVGQLVARLGVPNMLSHVDDDPARGIPTFRYLTGLASLGDEGRSPEASAKASLDDIQIVSTIRNLLLMSRDELAAETTTFGAGSHPPTTVLGIWWGLHVDDFSGTRS